MIAGLVAALALAGAPEADSPERTPLSDLRSPPEGWVDLRAALPGAHFEVRYHGANNFTGAPLPGYGAPGAWLQREPAEALGRVQSALEARGYSLWIYDAYRPLRGTLAMVAWAERTDQVHLLDNGYIARRSGHNKGHTVDLSVGRLGEDAPLDMGTPWDTLTQASHTFRAEGEPLAHRILLKEAMEAEGFRPYLKEWWHFSYPLAGKLPHRDVPYACWEAEEGAWTAPQGWEQPGFTMPSEVQPGACEGQPTK